VLNRFGVPSRNVCSSYQRRSNVGPAESRRFFWRSRYVRSGRRAARCIEEIPPNPPRGTKSLASPTFAVSESPGATSNVRYVFRRGLVMHVRVRENSHADELLAGLLEVRSSRGIGALVRIERVLPLVRHHSLIVRRRGWRRSLALSSNPQPKSREKEFGSMQTADGKDDPRIGTSMRSSR